ncbi:MAG: hypothetical protein FJ253_07015 [Phycisphaerae bacterium]|nr:hypothetical protein [Phycisphaerae bacterium]
MVQLDSSGMALVPGLDLIDTEKNECPIKSVEPSELSLDCADVGTKKVPVVVTYFNGLAIECTATVDVLPTPRYTGESGDWNDAENWCTGLPTADSDVTIHSTVGVTSDDAVAHGVVIQDGGTLRVGFENASGGPDQALLTVGASITIESGGALEILIDGAVSAGSITVMSGGTLRLDDSSSLLMVGSLTIEPGGVLEWIAGTIELSGVMQVPVDLEIGCIARPADGVTSSLLRLLGGTVVAPAVAICDAGTVDGAGAVISAFVSNSGVLTPGEPPASLLLTGDLLQNEGGTTEIRLAGTVPVQQYGVLNVSGNAGFEGTVDIVLDAPFVPKSGDLFAVIAVAGTVDPEAIPSLPPLPPGLEWSASWQTVATVTSLVLEVIEPGVACRNAQLQLGPDGTAILQPEQVIGDSGQCDIVDVELSQSFFDCSNVGPNMVEVTIFCKSGSMFTCDAQVTVLPTPRYQGPAFGSWFDVENWCSGLPTELSDVTVFNTVIVDDGNALAQNLTIENGGTVIVGSFDPLVGESTGGSLTVASTITIQQGGKLLIAPGGFVDALTVLVQPGAMLEIDGGELDAVGIVVLPGGSAKLSNGALLVLVNATLSMASTLDWLDGTIVVSGTLNSEIAFQIGCVLATQDQGGGESTLVLDGGTVTAPSVTICALGTLIGTGTVNSPSVTNSGEIAPGTSPGAITIQGTLDNMPTGVIRLEIAGLDPGTGYDLLTTTASGSTVGGVIIVSLDGFEPACSDSFEMIRIRLASTIQPPDATLAALPGGFYWSVQWVTIANEAVFTVTVRRVADFNFDCVVDGDDLGTMLGAWGPCEGCPEDLNDDGEVNGDDLGSLLGLWS